MDLKSVAIDFLSNCASGNVQAAYDKYVAPDFIHHNQYFAGDRQTLLDAMKQAALASPNRKFEVKQSVVDRDRVWTFSHVVKDNMEIVVLHITRFSNGKIVEMWDSGQIIDPKSPNQNGVF